MIRRSETKWMPRKKLHPEWSSTEGRSYWHVGKFLCRCISDQASSCQGGYCTEARMLKATTAEDACCLSLKRHSITIYNHQTISIRHGKHKYYLEIADKSTSPVSYKVHAPLTTIRTVSYRHTPPDRSMRWMIRAQMGPRFTRGKKRRRSILPIVLRSFQQHRASPGSIPGSPPIGSNSEFDPGQQSGLFAQRRRNCRNYQGLVHSVRHN